jgi:endoglucanase
MLLRAYEVNPEAFTDGQLTIPESGNGIPDIIDEALWNLRASELLQEADGGVRNGFESYRHPWGRVWSDEDPLPYWTYTRDAPHGLRISGLFAQAARLIEPFDPVRSADLKERAVRALDYALGVGVTEIIGGPMMFSVSELSRLTAEERYDALFTLVWTTHEAFDKGPAIYGYIPWRGSYTKETQPIIGDYVLGYMGSAAANPEYLGHFKDRIKILADNAVDAVENDHAHRNGRQITTSPTWGAGTSVGLHVRPLYHQLQIGDQTPAARQPYIDAISLSADYMLGCNPMGRVFITQLGTRFTTDPRHADSNRFIYLGMGAMPGIPSYGPTKSLPNLPSYEFGGRLMYPTFDELPLLRRYADVNTFINNNEFDVRPQVANAELVAVLLPPGMQPPESWLPGGSEHKNTLAPREGIVRQ